MLTTRQVAARLGIHPRTLEAMRSAGRGPRWVRVGGVIRYDDADLAVWIGEHTGPTARPETQPAAVAR